MKNILVILLCGTITTSVFSQESIPKFDSVKFEMVHAMRIPYNKVLIEFDSFLQKENVKVKIKSSSAEKTEKWNYAEIDTTFVMDLEKFTAITDSIYKINPQHIIKNVKSINGMATDGYSCKLQFGDFTNHLTYTLNSPSAVGELKDFYNTCLFIIKSVGLEPFKILEKPRTKEGKADALEYLRKLE